MPDYGRAALGKINDISQNVTANTSLITSFTGNLFDQSKANIGYIITSDGTTIQTSTSYDTSTLITVSPGIYRISRCRRIATFNSSNALVNVYDLSTPAPKTITISSSEVKFRVSFEKTQTPIAVINQDYSGNALYTKSMTVFGDSICAGAGFSGGYAGIISKNNNMSFIQRGISGSTIAVRNGFTNSVYETLNASNDITDYIIIEGGCNDCMNNVPIGSITSGYSDTWDVTTFYGAMEKMISTAISKWPSKKIGFMSVHNMSSRTGLENYFNAAEAVCKKWSVPYLDLFHKSGLNTNITSLKNMYTQDNGAGTGTGDGTHPNEMGYRIFYTPKIEAWMKSF